MIEQLMCVCGGVGGNEATAVSLTWANPVIILYMKCYYSHESNTLSASVPFFFRGCCFQFHFYYCCIIASNSLGETSNKDREGFNLHSLAVARMSRAVERTETGAYGRVHSGYSVYTYSTTMLASIRGIYHITHMVALARTVF